MKLMKRQTDGAAREGLLLQQQILELRAFLSRSLQDEILVCLDDANAAAAADVAAADVAAADAAAAVAAADAAADVAAACYFLSAFCFRRQRSPSSPLS